MKKEDYLNIITSHLEKSYNLSNEKIDEMLPRFLSRLAEYLQMLEQEIANNNIEAVALTSHTLKGALLNLGLKELADEAWIIEKKYKSYDNSVDYKKVFNTLQKEIRIIL